MNEFLSGLLNQIELKMVALQADSDLEVSHSMADEYLLTLIKNLATDENREQLSRIIEAYNTIDKWYA